MPRFSIIVPVYNGATFLGQTLDSLAAQTASDFEVIVVDDGSTDGSAVIASRHPVRPRVVPQQNLGVAAARNVGVAHAQGDWLAFLDQDDIWHPRRLARLGEAIGKTDLKFIVTPDRMFARTDDRQRLVDIDAGVASMVHAWIDSGHEVSVLCGDASPFDLAESFEPRQLGLEDLLVGTVVTTTSFVVHAEFMRLLGGWSLHGRSIDDWWLMANAARVMPLLMVDEPTHFYRVHSRATSLQPGLFYTLGSSVLALRLGGNAMSLEQALRADLDNSVLRHFFIRTVASPEFWRDARVRQVVVAMSDLLWPDGWGRRHVRRQRLKRGLGRLVRGVG